MNPSRQALFLTSIMLILFTKNYTLTITACAWPMILQSMHHHPPWLLWIQHAYHGSAALSLIPSYLLSQRVPHYPYMMILLGLFLLGSLLIATLPYGSTLVLGRIFQGLGFNVLPLSILMLDTHWPAARLRYAYSLCVASLGAGMVGGPLLAHAWLPHHPWTTLFGISVLGAFLSLWCLKQAHPQAHKPHTSIQNIPVWRLLAYCLIMVACLLACIPSAPIIPSLVCAGISAGLFYQFPAQSTDTPILLSLLYQDQSLRLVLGIRMIYMMIFASLLWLMPWLMTHHTLFGLSGGQALLILSTSLALTSYGIRHQLHKHSHHTWLMRASVITLLASLLASQLTIFTLPWLLLSLILWGAGAAITFQEGTFALTHTLSQTDKAAGLAGFFTMANLGASLGTLLSYHMVYTLPSSAHESMHAFHQVMWACVCLSTMQCIMIDRLKKLAIGFEPTTG